MPTSRFLLLILPIAAFGCKMTNSDAQEGHYKYTNELIHESSPYLLQHAHNPVNWNAWNDKTLKKAKDENKLLLISIGYAACHWCHVMEHESFEDTTVARLMNDNFIPIKVDREERPDVDGVYMTACQLASQKSCGWPLNAIAMPDGRPVWASTYFPKKNWIEVLEYFKKEWESNPQRLEEYAVQLTLGLGQVEAVPGTAGNGKFTRQALDDAARAMLRQIDFKLGGRNGAPKFPMPNNYQFLLKYHHLTGDEKALEAVTLTLDAMANGGIYDHLGGGFARYSTDEQWVVPHFEKMLYDNGQLVSLYSQAYQVTQNPLYKKVVEETLAFVRLELTAPEGAFYSSLDADSDGEEGKFYVWKKAEIDSILASEKIAAVFDDFYEIKEKGNWEKGKNILHRRKAFAGVAEKYGISEAYLNDVITTGRKRLLNARSGRVRPHLDDKALTAWNALMLKGYVDAYRAFGDPAFLDPALNNGRFIASKMLQKDSRLYRNYKDGNSVINAFLDDYALAIDAFVALYQVTFDEQWLYRAKGMAEYVLWHFSDKESGLFFYTSDLDPALVTRKMEMADNVIPGSNSVMARDLYLLGEYFYHDEWKDRAAQVMNKMAASTTGSQHPDFYSNWCQLYLDLVKPPYEVAIVGTEAAAKRDELMRHYIPDALLLGGMNEGTLELLKDKLQRGITYIYVCQNKVCKLPVEEPQKALELMK